MGSVGASAQSQGAPETPVIGVRPATRSPSETVRTATRTRARGPSPLAVSRVVVPDAATHRAERRPCLVDGRVGRGSGDPHRALRGETFLLGRQAGSDDEVDEADDDARSQGHPPRDACPFQKSAQVARIPHDAPPCRACVEHWPTLPRRIEFSATTRATAPWCGRLTPATRPACEPSPVIPRTRRTSARTARPVLPLARSPGTSS